MNLIPSETVLFESDTKEFVLTTHRLIFGASRIGQAQFVTIPIDELSGVEFTYKSQPYWIVIALMCGLFAWNAPIGMIRDIFTVGAALFFVWYFITRNRVLKFGSSSASIHLKTAGMTDENVKSFADEVLKARNRYLHNKVSENRY